jgi:hypothetical protein
MRWPWVLVGGNDVGSGTLGGGTGVNVGTVMLIGVGKGEPFCAGSTSSIQGIPL